MKIEQLDIEVCQKFQLIYENNENIWKIENCYMKEDNHKNFA